MKKIVWVLVMLSLVTVKGLYSQSILQQYYNGDSTKMLTEALGLVAFPDPIFQQPLQLVNGTADRLHSSPQHAEQVPITAFRMRDGKSISAYRLLANRKQCIIFFHGVNSDAADYLPTARALRKATDATVYAIDLRGHGKSAGKPGDVDYINQYTDDLSDLIAGIRRVHPGASIFLAGHSMGGGILLKFAGLHAAEKINGYILLAPLLGHNSPAIAQEDAPNTSGKAPVMALNIQRIIGLKMLNELGRHEKDSLPVLFFNAPEGQLPRTYSFRANMSMAPDDYSEGLKAVGPPLLVLIGSRDEVFDATKQADAVKKFSHGQLKIIQGAMHDDICRRRETFATVSGWIKGKE